MKTSFLTRLCLAVAAAVLFVQCSSTPQTRIEKNPQMFTKLSPKERHLVTHGLICEGMGRDAVFLAWGRPDSVSVGVNRGRESENWTYEGQQPVRSMNMGLGMGFGGWGPYGYGGWGPYGFGGFPYWNSGTSVSYVPYTAGVVEFVGGKVVSWKSTKR
ncbi:hypothetical protein [Prosthecobacter vanneervenii]|uniref:Lipoprotein n=1 Tax=Prosthecobacter vanneervenii TaxID=48466 RepID=A0A7W7Y7M2_9BACT|nr:hypothetical protein [Prosthecobacter vanneervenii]MBB5031089.1 hypothetical protein [Prosthecobacter vanneervenii]